jgi:hypothetical protein
LLSYFSPYCPSSSAKLNLLFISDISIEKNNLIFLFVYYQTQKYKIIQSIQSHILFFYVL